MIGFVTRFAVVCGCLALVGCSSEQSGLGDASPGGDETEGGAGADAPAKQDKPPFDSSASSADSPSGTVDAPGTSVDAPKTATDAALTDGSKTDLAAGPTDGPTNQENGAVCRTGADCKSKFCADGFCCEQACGGACMACAAGLTGKPNGACQPQLDNTVCSSTLCRNDRITPASVCRANSCVAGGAAVDCPNHLRCDAAGIACRPSCSTNADCVQPFVCDANGRCDVPKKQGAPCDPAAKGRDCQTNNCSADGVCCNTACNNGCESCTAVGKGGGSDGTCGVATALDKKPCGTFCLKSGKPYFEIAKKICEAGQCVALPTNRITPDLIEKPCSDADPCTLDACDDDLGRGPAVCHFASACGAGQCCCKNGDQILGCTATAACKQPTMCRP